MPEDVKRRYDSTRRRQQAQENRERILRTAGDLFADRGYGATTVADVAEAAGVAVETIYAAFRNKPMLLRRAWDVAVGGDDRDVHLLDRPEMRAVFAEPDLARRLARFAGVNTAVMRRTARLRLAIAGAADGDRTAAELLDNMDRERLDAMTRHARAAAETGQLAVDEDTCRDVLVATTDGTLWRNLVLLRGWSDERYAAWLGRMWIATLTAGEPPPEPH